MYNGEKSTVSSSAFVSVLLTDTYWPKIGSDPMTKKEMWLNWVNFIVRFCLHG